MRLWIFKELFRNNSHGSHRRETFSLLCSSPKQWHSQLDFIKGFDQPGSLRKLSSPWLQKDSKLPSAIETQQAFRFGSERLRGDPPNEIHLRENGQKFLASNI